MQTHRIRTLIYLLLIFPVVSLISSCMHDADISQLPEICFERDVLPIYTNNCAIAGCHTSSSGDHERFALENYTEIKSTVVPYKPDQSQSYNAIISKWGGEGHMPPNQVISKEKRTIIRVWIEQGANETTCLP